MHCDAPSAPGMSSTTGSSSHWSSLTATGSAARTRLRPSSPGGTRRVSRACRPALGLYRLSSQRRSRKATKALDGCVNEDVHRSEAQLLALAARVVCGAPSGRFCDVHRTCTRCLGQLASRDPSPEQAKGKALSPGPFAVAVASPRKPCACRTLAVEAILQRRIYTSGRRGSLESFDQRARYPSSDRGRRRGVGRLHLLKVPHCSP